MTTAYEDIDLIPAMDDLAPPGDDEFDNLRFLHGAGTAEQQSAATRSDMRESYKMVNGRAGAKSTPDNVRWLRGRVGAGPLSFAMLKGGGVVRVAGVGDDGYQQPAHADDDNGPATVGAMDGTLLTTLIADEYFCYVELKDPDNPEKPIRREEWFPPADAARALSTPDLLPYLRSLRGTTFTPMVRADGSILEAAGFDDQSGYLHVPDVTVAPVPERPTDAQVHDAVTLLRGLVDQFAWLGEHDEANFLGLLLTPLLRLLTPPPYKLGAIMARQPGSGKTLLSEVLRIVHGGVFRAEMPHDEAELEKSLSGILYCTTAPVVTFDNVSGVLRSSKLAGLLTSAKFDGRLLGSTNSVPMVNDRLWTITGNNLNLGGDLPRRTLWVTIDPGCPDPERRTGFRLNLSVHVAEHRSEILHALLVLVRAWVAAGMPAEERSSDSYARWSAVVRGILVNAGVPGEFDHRDSAQQEVGTDDEGWGEFLSAVHDVMGDRAWLARELVEKIVATVPGGGFDPQPVHPDLVEALPGDLHEKFLRGGGKSLTRPLGMWLRNRNGRWAGPLVCVAAGRDGRTKHNLFRVHGVGTHPQSPEPIQW